MGDLMGSHLELHPKSKTVRVEAQSGQYLRREKVRDVTQRTRRNRIVALKDELGNWEEDQAILQDLARNYYAQLYLDNGDPAASLPSGFSNLPQNAWEALTMNVTDDEFYQAVAAMGSLKAPGKDGLNPLFYKKCWEFVGKDMIQFARSCWEDPRKVKRVNATILVLIPKVAKPTLL
ncbi:unnamed protein product [Linum trigynum]|uniref:Reverse transcriptase n=1 Tax=Linum trigynum TaxID=586398 RepID=A0AAV2G4W2_9ROSI